MKKRLIKIKKRVEWDSNHLPDAYRLWLLIFYGLLSMYSGFCRFVRINLVFFEDTTFISSKSHFNRCSYQHSKNAYGRTDRQTAFQLYIADCSIPSLLHFWNCTTNITKSCCMNPSCYIARP